MSLRFKIEAAIVLLLILVSSLLYIFYNKYKEEKGQKEGVEQLFSKSQDSVKVYKNVHGRLVSRANGLILENKTIKQLVKDGNLSFLKEFQGLKSNYRNLEYVYQILSKSVDSLHIKLNDTTRTYIDSKGDTIKFKAQDWKFKDKWSDFSVKQISPDSADFKYSVEVPLEGVLYWKRKWFLGKKHWTSEITSENPHVHIPKLLNIKIGKK